MSSIKRMMPLIGATFIVMIMLVPAATVSAAEDNDYPTETYSITPPYPS
ncbi:MAG: hypothetical protein WCQ23_06450 [Candidatus Methanomethylophilaceae archaeon]|jgi:hypothetical protein